MVAFNLLPWRVLQRKYQTKVIKFNLSVAAIIAIFLLCIGHEWFVNQSEQKRIEIGKLNQEIDQFHKLESNIFIPKQNNEFTQARKFNENFFKEVTQDIKTSTCFTKITRKKNSIKFFGYTPSATELTDFLKNWSGAYLFSEMRLVQLEYKPELHSMKFQFRALPVS